MPSRTVISEEVVKFTVDGLAKGESSTLATLGRIAKAVQRTSSLALRAFGGLRVAAGAAGVAALAFRGFQGTRESDQFMESITYLTRVLATEFAPVLRIVTALVVLVADGIRSIPSVVKQAGVGIAILAGLFAVLGGPITAVIMIVVGLSIALLDMSDDAEEMAARLEPVFRWFGEIWNALKYIVGGAITYIGGKMQQLAQIGENLWNGDAWDKGLDEIAKNTDKALDDLLQKAGEKLNQLPGHAKDAAKRTADALKAIREGLKGIWGDAQGPLHMKVAVQIETPQSTWERIQKAMAEGKSELNPKLDEHLGAIRNKLDGIINAVKGNPGVKMGQ